MFDLSSDYSLIYPLILRYYRKQNNFTHHLSATVIKIFPWAAMIHFCYALMMFSYPYTLKSPPQSGSDYSGRFGQTHMFKYLLVFGIGCFFVVFEDMLKFLYRQMIKLMKRCTERNGYCCMAIKKRNWFPDPIPVKHERVELYEKLSFI